MENDFNFLVYQTAQENVSVNALVKNETIWLTQKAMAELFDVDKSSISRHLKNIFNEGELDESGCCKNCNNHSTRSNRGKNAKQRNTIHIKSPLILIRRSIEC